MSSVHDFRLTDIAVLAGFRETVDIAAGWQTRGKLLMGSDGVR